MGEVGFIIAMSELGSQPIVEMENSPTGRGKNISPKLALPYNFI